MSRRQRRPQPNERVQRVAQLAHRSAREVTEAVEHLNAELDAIGYSRPSDTNTSGGGGGGRSSSPVERDAMRALNLLELREDLRDAIGELEEAMSKLSGRILYILPRAPAAEGVALCSDNQHGRDGADEWGEPCLEIPAKRGLCGACYMRERRWREREGLPLRDEP